jgi:hypothetical protein
MEAAHTLPFAKSRTVAGQLLIDGLRVDDETVVRLAREREDAGDNPDKLVRDALEIGARVLDREKVGAQTDVVKAEFEALRASLTDRTKALADRMDAKVDEVFRAEEGDFALMLAKHFGDESSTAVQHRVRAVLSEMAGQMREDLRKQLLTDGDDNPLSKFHKIQLAVAESTAKRHAEELRAVVDKMEAMRVEVERLRADHEKGEALDAEAERGTAKGRTYEEAVADAIEAIAGPRGGDSEAVGDTRGEGGRKGDVVVGVDGAAGAPRGRIVFEAKNSKLSRNEALSQLDGARQTRGADYAVLVVPSEDKLPARCPQLREFNGDKCFVVFDPDDGSALALEVAYSLARARVLVARGDSGAFDAEALRAEVERAQGALEDVRRIKSQLSNARTGIDRAEEIVETMRGAVRAHLIAIDQLLSSADED